MHRIDKIAGLVIRRVRERAGVTQEVLAAKTRVSYQQIQKYESGANRISISRLFEIAAALDTTAYELIRLITFEIQAIEDF